MIDQALPDPSGLQPASLMFGQVAAPEPIARHDSGMPSAVATQGPIPDEEAPTQQPNHPARTEGKPFAFGLAHGIGGAQVWYGQLISLSDMVAHAPANLNTNRRLTTHLGWFGNVYLYWEEAGGTVTLCDVRGPDEPDSGGGKYWVLIGAVPRSGPVDQKVSSDVCWGGSSIAANYAFSRTYTDGSGNLMMQGGMVTGGTRTHVLADKLLLASGGTAPADGKMVVMHIGLTAITDDGVVLPGCTLDSDPPTIAVNISTMPSNGIPDDSDPGGDLYVYLGYWRGGTFYPANAGGNITVVHWLGSLTAYRGG
jgi:hypothetical protein